MSSRGAINLARPPPTARGTWPISRVVTVCNTLATCAILFLACAFLYWVMGRSLEEEDHHSLADQVETLRLTLKEKPGDPEALKMEVQSEGAARRFAKYYARVLNKEGKVLMETSDMERLLPPPEAFPPPANVGSTPNEGRHWKSPNGKFFLLMAAWAETGAAQEEVRLLQLALDVTQEEVVLAKYRRMLALVLLLGVVCSASLGAFITRRAMRPLREITAAAQHITAAQLHERIQPERWPQDLMALATAFDDMLGRLETSFTRLTQFSADLAHEIRTPIASLRGEAELALGRSQTPDEYRRVLESSMEEYERLSRMVDSLLFLARSDNAEVALTRQPFPATPEVQAVLDLFDAAAAEKSIEVKTSGDAVVHGDAVLFRRALSNLVANAVHHTPVGGRITILVKPLENGATGVVVTDPGCGIPADHLPKVFDRFYRVDPSRHQPGAGLGLAIVKSIMELHGGAVSLNSEVGNGTAVSLRFPYRHPSLKAT